MSKNTALSAHLALFGVALFYGLNYFIAKGIFAHVPPLAMVAIRNFSGIIIFSLIFRFFYKEKIQSRQDYIRLFFCGVFGATLNQVFFFSGLSRTTAVNASILMITTPLFVFLIAYFLKTEKMTLLKLGGLIISFLGAVFLSLGGKKFDINDETALGDLMVMINAAAYAYYLIIVKPLMLKYNIFTIVMWVFIFGGSINILIGLPELISIDWSIVPTESYWGIAYVIIFATIGTYLLNAVALARVPSSAVGVYIYLQPVIVGLISLFWFDFQLTVDKAIYMLMMIIGVVAVSYRKKSN